MKTDILPNDDILKYYFYFIEERMNIFWRKTERCKDQYWTNDPILRKYKFTNVYRSTDRISQYLIKNVIYKNINSFKPEDILLRILVFKVFNKIETWEYLNENLSAPLCINKFDVNKISKILSERQKHYPIFSNAYMMTGSHKLYESFPSKHERWLHMIKQEFIDHNIFDKIIKAESLEEIYNILIGQSFIGSFLAYQYAIDFNYSPFINFSENSFVKAGIGAIRGIKKCFYNYGDKYEDAIYYIHDNFDILKDRYNHNNFRALPNHQPTLIDLQNCFCETDKYLRAKVPELKVDNSRIKQTYKESSNPIFFFFPPKWNISNNDLCTNPNTKELTIF